MARTLLSDGPPGEASAENIMRASSTTVELNGVFYRTPTPESVRRWSDQTGRHFVFAWKASKFIRHWKRLSENSISKPATPR